jgi:Peptidase family S41
MHDFLLSCSKPVLGHKKTMGASMLFYLAFATAVLLSVPVAASGPGEKGAATQLPNSPKAWSAAAKRDIQAAYQETFNNHPGPHDVQNPQFLQRLKKARQDALALAARVTNGPGYRVAVLRFRAVLQDGHAGTNLIWEKLNMPPRRWPGFITVWRGNGLFVFESEAGGPTRGAQVLACDGVPMRELILKNVFAFYGREKEAGLWWEYAPLLLVDDGNPFLRLPHSCRFAFEGRIFSQPLTWRPANEHFKAWVKLVDGDKLAIGMTEPRPNLLWVAMPTFTPDEAERATYRQMFKQIIDQREKVRKADALVIDLRHNQGGNSVWSVEFAQALWGEARVDRRMAAYSVNTRIWWRASRDNAQYFAQEAEQAAQEKEVATSDWLKKKFLGMQKALDQGKLFYIQEEDAAAPTNAHPEQDLPTDPPPFEKPVYVIVPGQCASSCLDAVDVFTRFANTKLIGAPSSADSTYMEVRYKTLDSGLAYVIIPNKVYVNRPRGNGQFYVPEILVTDLEWNSSNFLRVVETDLAARK